MVEEFSKSESRGWRVPHVSASLYVIKIDVSIGDTHEFLPVLNYHLMVAEKSLRCPDKIMYSETF